MVSFRDAEAPRARKEWIGTGSLRPDAKHVSATPSFGVLWEASRGPVSRVWLVRYTHEGAVFYDLREEVLDDGKWSWTFRGLQIEVSRGADLARALEGACTP